MAVKLTRILDLWVHFENLQEPTSITPLQLINFL